MIGSVVSHYRILEELGRGGMGVVYKAEDTKLRRTVALKFLPPVLLAGEEEKKRFIREAQAAAALGHPNIATVFAIDDVENEMFIALEYVDGRSLDKKISSGPLKLKEALDIALQLCEGLQEAHEKGIVHRDIKAANIMVTDKGQVKILDFGLAKLKGASRVTQDGSTLGTLGYMSPEQMRGEVVDQRTDVWSVGILLYEMISGRLPFAGEYKQAIAYQILNEQPAPLTSIRTGVPMELERVINKAMCKDPADRYQHMDEMLVDLRATKKERLDSSSLSRGLYQQPARGPLRRWKAVAPWGVTLVLATALALLLWRSTHDPGVPSPLYRSRVALDAGKELSLIRTGMTRGNLSLAVSPDGRKSVFAAGDTQGVCLYYRDLAALEVTSLPGTENAEMPFFSPDGQWVGFAAEGKIKKISVLGGRPFDICSVKLFGGGAWGVDDTVTFSDMENGCLWRVSASGGTPFQVTFKPRDFEVEQSHIWPQILDDRRAILFTGGGYTDVGKISVFSLDTRKRRTLFEDGWMARYVPTGHIIYARAQDGGLYAVPFDIKTLEVTGPHVPVLAGISFGDGCPQLAVSHSGVLVYAPEVIQDQRSKIVWVDQNGKETILPLSAGHYHGPRLSPDGKWLLYGSGEKQSNLWLLNLIDGSSRPFTDTRGDAYWAAWMPDSRQIVYNMSLYNDTTNAVDMYRKSIISHDPGERLTAGPLWYQPCCLTADGKRLIFQQGLSKETRIDLFEMTLDSLHATYPLVQTNADDHLASLSPDNRWLAYTSDESGRSEVYVRPYHADGNVTRVSRDGGTGPLWSPDGRELYFRDYLRGGRVFRSTVHPGQEIRFEDPRLLFEGSYTPDLRWGRNYDISPDDKRFIFIKYEEGKPLKEYVVVTNWFDELKRKFSDGSR